VRRAYCMCLTEVPPKILSAKIKDDDDEDDDDDDDKCSELSNRLRRGSSAFRCRFDHLVDAGRGRNSVDLDSRFVDVSGADVRPLVVD